MKTDSNTAALSQYEAEQDKRQRSYDALEPKAKALLREWVRDGETIGKPVRFAGSGFSPFVLADFIGVGIRIEDRATDKPQFGY